jgi:hypothetical protein
MTASRAFALGGFALAIIGAVGAIVVRVASQAPFHATIHEAIAPRSFGIWLRDDRG